MSVNLHLAIVVREYRPEKATAIKKAIQQVIAAEALDNDLPPLVESKDETGTMLKTQSNRKRPVIISGFGRWSTAIEKTLRSVVEQANGGPCQVDFQCEDADAP